MLFFSHSTVLGLLSFKHYVVFSHSTVLGPKDLDRLYLSQNTFCVPGLIGARRHCWPL